MSNMSPFEIRKGQPAMEDNALELDAEMQQVLSDLRSSVHAWSDAAYHRPRTIPSAEHRVWRSALGWALGCLLAAGAVSTGLYQSQHKPDRNQTAQQTVQPHSGTAVQQNSAKSYAAMVQEQPAGEEDDALMAKVDSEVSRQVPSAMDPLAQLLDEDGSE